MLTLYTFRHANGEFGSWSTMDPNAAQEYAREYELQVIANEYEFADSEPVNGWDFRPEQEVSEAA